MTAYSEGKEIDATCEDCGARSRPGFQLPDQGCPESFNGTAPHEWKPTQVVNDG